MDLSCDRWAGVKPSERESIARDLAKQLPLGFEFHAVESRRYPTDVKPKDRPDWELHREPNAFGLIIASDPYKSELVAEAGVTRGGDGGGTICGGAGYFAGGLTLATAFFDKEVCVNDPTDSIAHGYTVCRRVLPLK